MSLYYVMNAHTGEIVRDVTSDQLQAADKLLNVSERRDLMHTTSDRANRLDRAAIYGDAHKHSQGFAGRRSPARRTIPRRSVIAYSRTNRRPRGLCEGLESFRQSVIEGAKIMVLCAAMLMAIAVFTS